MKEGSCDESFGIHVAKLAGMPGSVVARAREILENLQRDSLLGNIRSKFSEEETKEKQMDFFERGFKDHPVMDKIKALDVENLTPIEALKRLAELKKEVTGGE